MTDLPVAGTFGLRHGVNYSLTAVHYAERIVEPIKPAPA
jgi:hypothetical protein